MEIRTWGPNDLAEQLPRWEAYLLRSLTLALSLHPAWLRILHRGLGHEPLCLEAREDGQTKGLLPLAYLNSWLFGKFLVALPYVNYGGVRAEDADTAHSLVDRAIQLADERRVRYLELRHAVQTVEHPSLVLRPDAKVHMHLTLPGSVEALWKQLDAKVRNQVRKGQKSDLTVHWGAHDLLPAFYAVFSQNMRDLGTPAFGKALFRSILDEFPQRAELCVVRAGQEAVGGALLLHGWGVTEVPSASTLRESRGTNANMLMYWHLLERSAQRGQQTFDFGRSSPDSNTYRFKKQWGATPAPAQWQYYLRTGAMDEMRKENPRYQRMIRIWQRLPLAVTRLIGPWIVRGIP